MITVKVEGLQALGEKLRELEATARTKLLRAATGVAASSIRKEVSARIPVLTGTAKRAIYVQRLTKSSGDGLEVFQINVRKGKRYENLTLKFGKDKGKTVNMDAYYAKFLEFGTRKMGAKPFMRPAFEAKKEAAIEAFKIRLQAGLKPYGLK